MGKRTKSRCKHQNDRDKVSETDCGGGARDKLFKSGRGKASRNKGNKVECGGEEGG